MPAKKASPSSPIEDPALAYKMAHAEKPYRDDVAENNAQLAAASTAATRVVKYYIRDKPGVGFADTEEAERKVTLARRATEENGDLLEDAEWVAEAVRRQHEG